MKLPKNFTRLAALFGAWLASATAYAAVKASVDNDQVAPGETIGLTLSHEGRTGAQPDLKPLEQDFDVLSTSRSSNVRIINGSMSSETRLALTISPKRSGQLMIPPITWDNEQSTPIRISVGGSGNSQGGATQAQSSTVFLKTTADDLQPYVQGAVTVTVRLYAAVPLYRASLDLPASSDVLVQQVGKDRTSDEEIDGRRYKVIERRYALFPQHSGAVNIPGPLLDGQVALRSRNEPFSDDDFFSRSPFGDMMQSVKPIRIHGDDIALQVKPRPASATASYWVPTKNFTVTSEWHPDSLEAQAGEPITLDLHLRAEGLTAAQLPDVASLLQIPPGLKAYPDQPKLKNTPENGTLVGERDQSIALIADRAGDFKLPAANIQWWDTGANQLRTIELPARTLKVSPGAPGATSIPAPNRAPQSAPAIEPTKRSAPPVNGFRWPWQWVSLALVILWLGTLLAWWLSRRREPNTPLPLRERSTKSGEGESQARERFLSACRLNDATAARRALLEWTRAKWPDSPPTGLQALARRIEDSNTEVLLIELDRACFAGGEWNGAALANALARLPSQPDKKKTTRAELAELYP
jgi:hypothetical protein